MGPPTSNAMAVCVLVLVPLAYLFIAMRVYVRLQRKCWGMDDWCMMAAQPGFFVLVLSSLILSWNGLGAPDAAVSAAQGQRGLMWWFVWQTDWLFTMVPLKWTICCCLIRVAEGRKAYIYTTIAMGTATTLVMLATAFYEFGACKPIQYNWNRTIPGGKCMDPNIETGFSFALSAVNIVVDWYCATVPIPMLWNVQMRRRLKVSVAVILGLGVVASVSALVRLKYTINLSAATDFLWHIEPVAVWGFAEIGLGFIVSNLPALRPIYEKLAQILGFSGDSRPTDDDATGGNAGSGPSWKPRGVRDYYYELGTVKDNGVNATQTKVRGGRSEASGLEDNDSQTHIINDNNAILVSQEVHVSRGDTP